MSAKSISTRQPRTDLSLVDQELAGEVANIKSMISAGSSPKISLDRSGRWTAPDGLDLGTEIRGVVIDFVSMNRLYVGAYDANNPVPPVCFSIGKVLNDMVPHEDSPEPQHPDCTTCPHNQWGSRGKGKACKNTRELAFILEEDLEAPEPKLYLISVPPTAIKSFDAFANLCARVLNAPPIKALVTVKAVQQGTYTTMVFSDPDNNPFYADHMGLRAEAEAMLNRPPDTSNYVPSKPAPAPRAAARRR